MWLTILMLGAAVVLLAVGAQRLWSEVPVEDRRDRDRPPPLYRWQMPLIALVAHHLGWIVSDRRAAPIEIRLARAGMDYALSARQFAAGKLLGALWCAMAAGVVASAVEADPIVFGVGGALFGFLQPDFWLAGAIKRRQRQLLRALPFFLDVLTLAVEAGLNLGGALQLTVDRIRRGPLTVEIDRVLREVRGGRARVDALRSLAARLDFAPITGVVNALVQAELMGSSLGPVLRAQSDSRRQERFARAEKLAMEAPVKMLGPLIFFIFPCTFLILGFPIAMRLIGSGL